MSKTRWLEFFETTSGVVNESKPVGKCSSDQTDLPILMSQFCVMARATIDGLNCGSSSTSARLCAGSSSVLTSPWTSLPCTISDRSLCPYVLFLPSISMFKVCLPGDSAAEDNPGDQVVADIVDDETPLGIIAKVRNGLLKGPGVLFTTLARRASLCSCRGASREKHPPPFSPPLALMTCQGCGTNPRKHPDGSRSVRMGLEGKVETAERPPSRRVRAFFSSILRFEPRWRR